MFSGTLTKLKIDDGYAILFAVGVIVGFISLLAVHRFIKNKYANRLRIFYILSMVVFSAIAVIFSRLTGEAQSLAFGLIIGNGFPALYLLLESRFDQLRAEREMKQAETRQRLTSIDRKIRDLIDPEKAARSDLRLHHYIRDKLGIMLRYIYDNHKRLNDFVVGPPEKRAFGRIYVDAVFDHAQVAFRQLLDDRIFIKGEVFSRAWMRLTGESTSYLSVCDLSPYCNIWEPDLDDDIQDWELRLTDEIAHLKTLRGQKLEKFDKIIVYQKRQFIVSPDAAPSCVQYGTCEGSKCKTACIVKSVAERWLNSGLGGYFGSHAENSEGDTPSNLWLVERQNFANLFALVNDGDAANGRRITSLDIGLFGNHVVGEEFKLQGQTFRYVGGKPDLETPSTSERRRSFDYMYTMRSDKDLHARLEFRVLNAMNRADQVIPCPLG